MRHLSIIGVVLLATVLMGCEEGEEVDIDPGVTQDIDLVVTSADPGTAGNSVSVRATVTEDGNTVQGIAVTFSATNLSQEDRPAIPNPVDTSVLGFADTTISTVRADRQLTIRATAGSSTSNTVTLTLDPAP